MKKNNGWALAGLLGLYLLVGFVFYMFLFVEKFKAGVNWLAGSMLVYGLVGFILIAPTVLLYIAEPSSAMCVKPIERTAKRLNNEEQENAEERN